MQELNIVFLNIFPIESYCTATGVAQNTFVYYALFRMVRGKKLRFDSKLVFCSQKDKVQ